MNQIALCGHRLVSKTPALFLRGGVALSNGVQPVFARFMSGKAEKQEAEETAPQRIPMYISNSSNHS